jgi:CRP-like cAMP-binding protein
MEASIQRRAELLASLSGFSELPPVVRRDLADALKVENFPADGVVVAERQMGDRMYIIESGIASVSTMGANGPVILGQLLAGEMFGEIALVSKIRRRKATVTALTPLVTLSLAAEAFEKALAPYPEVLANFIQAAETLMRRKLQKLSDTK